MAIDVFFAGQQPTDVNDYILKNNYCRLFSQLDDWKDIIYFVTKIRAGESKSKLTIDSGAYSAKTRGVTIDLPDYVRKINEIGDCIYNFANLDVIPNSPSPTDVYESAKQGWENFMYIQTHCKYKEKCMFVYHRHDPTEFLDCAIAYYKNNPELKFFALGGLVALNDTFYFVRDVCSKIKCELPYIKIHLFGYTRFNKLSYFDFDSTDSTTWIQVGGLGYICTPWGTIKLSAKNKFHQDSIHSLQPDAKQVVLDYIEKMGYTVEELENDYKKRMFFNIDYFVQQANEIKYIKTSSKKQKLI